jgi:hypothetical protein
MATIDRGQVVIVSCRECLCSGAPGAHERDEVYLTPEPSLRLGLVAQLRITEAVRRNENGVEFDNEKATLDLFDAFIRYGAVGWNLLDEDGEERPFDVEAVLGDMSLGMPTADRASELYLKKVTDPLARKLAATSPTGPTVDSRSHRKKSTRKQHAPSSPATSAVSLRSVS